MAQIFNQMTSILDSMDNIAQDNLAEKEKINYNLEESSNSTDKDNVEEDDSEDLDNTLNQELKTSQISTQKVIDLKRELQRLEQRTSDQHEELVELKNESDRYKLLYIDKENELSSVEKEYENQIQEMEEKALKEKTEFDTSQTCISELQNKIRELEEEKRSLSSSMESLRATSILTDAVKEERLSEEERRKGREREMGEREGDWRKGLEDRERELVEVNAQLSQVVMERSEEVEGLKRELAKMKEEIREEDNNKREPLNGGQEEDGEEEEELMSRVRVAEGRVVVVEGELGREKERAGELEKEMREGERRWEMERKEFKREITTLSSRLEEVEVTREGLADQLRGRGRELRGVREEREILTIRLQEALRSSSNTEINEMENEEEEVGDEEEGGLRRRGPQPISNRPGGMRLIRDEVRFGDGPAKKVVDWLDDFSLSASSLLSSFPLIRLCLFFYLLLIHICDQTSPDQDLAKHAALSISWLEDVTCYHILRPSGKIIVLESGVPLQLAFFALLEHGVYSALIWDISSETFTSFFTLSDFLQSLLACEDSNTSYESLATLPLQDTLNSLNIDLSITSRLCAANSDEGLLSLHFLFREYSTQSVSVMDPLSSKALGMISPEDLLAYVILSCFYDKLDFMGEEVGSSCAMERSYPFVLSSTPLREVVGILDDNHLFSLPILEDLNMKGKLETIQEEEEVEEEEEDERDVEEGGGMKEEEEEEDQKRRRKVLEVYSRDDVRFLARSESVNDMLGTLNTPITLLLHPPSEEKEMEEEEEEEEESEKETSSSKKPPTSSMLKKKDKKGEKEDKEPIPAPILPDTTSVGECLRAFVQSRSHLIVFVDQDSFYSGATTPLLLFSYLTSLAKENIHTIDK